MKKIILVAILLQFGSYCIAQTFDSTQFKPKTYQYAEVVAAQKFLSTKLNIVISTGQHFSIWSDNRLKDANGSTVTFNSIPDVLNYMDNQGWDYLTALAVSEQSNGSVYHFFFRRKM